MGFVMEAAPGTPVLKRDYVTIPARGRVEQLQKYLVKKLRPDAAASFDIICLCESLHPHMSVRAIVRAYGNRFESYYPANKKVRAACSSCDTYCEVTLPATPASTKRVRYQVRCPNCRAIVKDYTPEPVYKLTLTYRLVGRDAGGPPGSGSSQR